MSIEMKDAVSGLVKYKGIAVEFCNYIAQHYELTYYILEIHVILIILIHQFHCESLEYVPENPLEVAKYGQNQAVINALVHKVYINGELVYIYFTKYIILFIQTIDLAMYGMTPSLERLKMFDMTAPAISEDFEIMVLWPEETSQLPALKRPYDSIVIPLKIIY